MPNLDRFAVGLADPQEEEPAILGKCQNESCTEMIVSGYEAYVWEDLYFCGINCFCQYMGLKEVNWD